MTDIVTELRTQALESTYGDDRRDAIERLAERYDRADEAERREILQTLADVARDATHEAERELARDRLADLYETDSAAAGTVVGTYCWLATEADYSGEREAALDRLRRIGRSGVSSDLRERIADTFATVSEEATYSAEREAARRGLSELPDDGATGRDGGGSTDSESKESDSYLAVSLTEHLSAARTEGADVCLTRAEELHDFVDRHPVDDDAYGEVRDELSSLVDQLSVVADAQSELGEQRRTQVERIADRTKRLYLRE
ncbi:hypothetical protein [Haloplanus pelagicus]|jgi:hypothetical protein|uniref:hypothetical protein n=1 Tax=Haloplanus pelagicus TaxID=2949995 RepID=UPI0020423159|nr:hypothetical protein [Haloplanus sp. HW8-1]